MGALINQAIPSIDSWEYKQSFQKDSSFELNFIQSHLRSFEPGIDGLGIKWEDSVIYQCSA